MIKKLLHIMGKTAGLEVVHFGINGKIKTGYLLHSDIE